MSTTVTVIVAVGLALALALGLAAGFDATGLVLFALLVLFGALSILAARKMGSGAAQPARCTRCGGLVSTTAPYCKHCGQPLE